MATTIISRFIRGPANSHRGALLLSLSLYFSKTFDFLPRDLASMMGEAVF